MNYDNGVRGMLIYALSCYIQIVRSLAAENRYSIFRYAVIQNNCKFIYISPVKLGLKYYIRDLGSLMAYINIPGTYISTIVIYIYICIFANYLFCCVLRYIF